MFRGSSSVPGLKGHRNNNNNNNDDINSHTKQSVASAPQYLNQEYEIPLKDDDYSSSPDRRRRRRKAHSAGHVGTSPFAELSAEEEQQQQERDNNNANAKQSIPDQLMGAAMNSTMGFLKLAGGWTMTTTGKLAAPPLYVTRTVVLPQLYAALVDYLQLVTPERIQDGVKLLYTSIHHVLQVILQTEQGQVVQDEVTSWNVQVVRLLTGDNVRQTIIDGMALLVKLAEAGVTPEAQLAQWQMAIFACRIMDVLSSSRLQQVIHQSGNVLQQLLELLADPHTTVALAEVTAHLLYTLEMLQMDFKESSANNSTTRDDDRQGRSQNQAATYNDRLHLSNPNVRMEEVMMSSLQTADAAATTTEAATAVPQTMENRDKAQVVHDDNNNNKVSSKGEQQQSLSSSSKKTLASSAPSRAQPPKETNKNRDLNATTPQQLPSSASRPAAHERARHMVDKVLLRREIHARARQQQQQQASAANDESDQQVVIIKEEQKRDSTDKNTTAATETSNNETNNKGEQTSTPSAFAVDQLSDVGDVEMVTTGSKQTDDAVKQNVSQEEDEESISDVEEVGKNPPATTMNVSNAKCPMQRAAGDRPEIKVEAGGNDNDDNSSLSSDDETSPNGNEKLREEAPLSQFYRVLDNLLEQKRQHGIDSQLLLDQNKYIAKGNENADNNNNNNNNNKNKGGIVHHYYDPDRHSHGLSVQQQVAVVRAQLETARRRLPDVATNPPPTTTKTLSSWMRLFDPASRRMIYLALVVFFGVAAIWAAFGCYGMYMFFFAGSGGGAGAGSGGRPLQQQELVVRILREVVHVDAHGKILSQSALSDASDASPLSSSSLEGIGKCLSDTL